MQRGSSTKGTVTKTGTAWMKQSKTSHRGPSETNHSQTRKPRGTGQLRQVAGILKGPDKGQG